MSALNVARNGKRETQMKKLALITLFMVAGCGAEPEIKTGKYWQDAILKPNQSWKEAYGTDKDSVLAHGVAQITRAINAQARAIGDLKKEQEALTGIVKAQVKTIRTMDARMMALEPVVDPNEVKE